MTRTLTPADLADLFDAFNRHDIAGVMRHVAEDCVFDAVAGPEAWGTRHEGRAAVARAFEAVWTAMPDAHWAHRDHLVQGDRAVSEWTFSGTAAEITPIRSVDKIQIGGGARGPVTGALQRAFFDYINGVVPDRHGWLTPVTIPAAQREHATTH